MSVAVSEAGGAVAAAQLGMPQSTGVDGAVIDATGTAASTKFVSFAIGGEHYGVNIMAVREIREWTDVTHLPKQPDYVRGVLNLRGVIVPIIDLRCRFGQGLTETTPLHIIIVVQIEDRQIGLLADRVLDIISFEAGKMQPVPKVADDGPADFLGGLVTIDSEMIALIDLSRLMAGPTDELSGQSR